MTNYSKQTKIDTTQSFQDRIGFLRHCAKVYETGASPITDSEYDKEYYELQNLNPNDSFFDEVGGIEENMYGTSVPHKIIMGSLSKSLTPEDCFVWLKSLYVDGDGPFLLAHKVDGLSLSILYQNGKLTQALTRGDGIAGIDVLANVKFIKSIPMSIKCQEEVEIRGEVYKNKQDFYKTWHKQGYKNCRNFASGSLNQKDAKITGERDLDFIAYEIVRKEFDTEVEKNSFLANEGFQTLQSSSRLTKTGNPLEHVYKAVKIYMDGIDRANLPYDIDGVVLKLNNCKQAKTYGSTDGGKRPKSNRAIKFRPSEAQTTLIGVEDSIGRDGRICPVGLLSPVDLDGATISRASLYNYAKIRDSKDLKIGSVVTIARKGDIIPQILDVVKVGHTDITLPVNCPSCGLKLEWDATEVNIMCKNEDCIAQLNVKIEHWFDKIGVLGIGPGIIGRLTDKSALSWDGQPIIGKLSHMYYKLNNDRQTEHPFQKYAYLKKMLGDRTYEILIDNIDSVKELTLAKFIEALGIGKIGSMSKEIVAIAPTIEDVDKLTVDDLKKIDKFGDIKATNFVEGWKKMRKEISNLLRSITIVQPKVASNKMKGMKFCFTGSFSVPREALQQMVVDNGGKAASSVGKDVILVWDGEENGSKLQKAQAGGNRIISEEEFMKILN